MLRSLRSVLLFKFAVALVPLALIVLATTPGHAEPVPVAIAVVVHPDVSVDGLTFADLRKIMRGDRRFWPGGTPITLLVRAPVASERDELLGKVYKMSESQFRQYWIAQVFRAETTSGPKIVLSNDMAVELVGALQGAITFVNAEEIKEGMKVLKIDGKLPGESGYPLNGE